MIENMAHVVVLGLTLLGQRMIAAVRIAPSVASPNSNLQINLIFALAQMEPEGLQSQALNPTEPHSA